MRRSSFSMRGLQVLGTKYLATCGLAPVAAQTLEIQPAVVLTFDSDAASEFVLESSTNAITWTPLTFSQLAYNDVITHVVPTNDPSKARQMFRVRSTSVDDLSDTLAGLKTNATPALGCAVVMDGSVVGVTNAGGNAAFGTTDSVVGAMISRYLP